MLKKKTLIERFSFKTELVRILEAKNLSIKLLWLISQLGRGPGCVRFQSDYFEAPPSDCVSIIVNSLMPGLILLWITIFKGPPFHHQWNNEQSLKLYQVTLNLYLWFWIFSGIGAIKFIKHVLKQMIYKWQKITSILFSCNFEYYYQ